MGYINTLKIIRSIVSREPLDSRALLSEVNERQIEQALRRSKDGLPQPFACTNEPIEEKNLAKMPSNAKMELYSIFQRLKISSEEAEKALLRLIELERKYPDVPAIYNYIGLAYSHTGQHEKYHQHIIETYKKFPDYLFAKISAAEYCINNNRHQEVPAIFDNKLEIRLHFPETAKTYHLSEVRAFHSILGIYYARSNRTARAIYCYMILNRLDPDHMATQKLADEIVLVEASKLRQRMMKTSQT